DDLAFGADDALCNGYLAGKEGTRDLGSRQASDGAESERDLRLSVQGRVAAGEEQRELIVHGRLRAHVGSLLQQRQLLAIARVPSPTIDRLAASGREQPGA